LFLSDTVLVIFQIFGGAIWSKPWWAYCIDVEYIDEHMIVQPSWRLGCTM